MSETIMTKAIFKDETAQTLLNKLDAIIAAINPVAQGVSFDNSGTGLSAENVQSAIAEVKSDIDTVNTGLPNQVKMKSFQIANADLSTGIDLTSYFTVDTGYKYLATTQIMGVGWIPSFPLFIDEFTKKLWYQGTLVGGSNVYVRVIYLEVKDV